MYEFSQLKEYKTLSGFIRKCEQELIKAGLVDYLSNTFYKETNLSIKEALLADNNICSYSENYSDEYGSFAIDIRFESDFPSFIYVYSHWKQVC